MWVDPPAGGANLATVTPLSPPGSFDGWWRLADTRFPSTGTELVEGSIIRFGKQVVRVRRIQLGQGSLPWAAQPSEGNVGGTRPMGANGPSVTSFRVASQASAKHNASAATCRICLEPETARKQFEKDLCACSRSMPAHVECLLSWIDSKCVRRGEQGHLVVDYSAYFCDICKQPYPQRIQVGGVARDVLDAHLAACGPSLHLDFFELNSPNIRHTLVLPLTGPERTLVVGRQKECQIFLKDVSVSRMHAKLRWSSPRLFVSDCLSKFGTAVLVKGPIAFDAASPLQLLSDRSRLTLQLVDPLKYCSTRVAHFGRLENPSNDPATVDSLIQSMAQAFPPANQSPVPPEQTSIPIIAQEELEAPPPRSPGTPVRVRHVPPPAEESLPPERQPSPLPRQPMTPQSFKKQEGSANRRKSKAGAVRADATLNLDRLEEEDPSRDSAGQGSSGLDSELKKINRMLESRGASLSSLMDVGTEGGPTEWRPTSERKEAGLAQAQNSSLFDLKRPQLETDNFTASSGQKEGRHGGEGEWEETDSAGKGYRFE